MASPARKSKSTDASAPASSQLPVETEKTKTPTKLSKNLMSLKFMQRAKETELRNDLEQQRQQKLDEFRWVVEKPPTVPKTNTISNITFEPSFFNIGTMPGRQKFSQDDDSQGGEAKLKSEEKFFTHQRYKNMAKPQSMESVLADEKSQNPAPLRQKGNRTKDGKKKRRASASSEISQMETTSGSKRQKREQAPTIQSSPLPFKKPK